MRNYETMFILKPTLTPEEIAAKIDFFKEILTGNGANIEGCIDMGMRNLAYEIKKNKRGYYFVIYFTAEPSLIAELERNYRITEDILRFIVINYRNKREIQMWQVLVDRANGKIEPKKPLKERDLVESTDNIAESGESSEAENAESSEDSTQDAQNV